MNCGHNKTTYHEASLKLADDFVRRFENPETELPNQFDQRKLENIEQILKSMKVLKSMKMMTNEDPEIHYPSSTVLWRQCIALWGDLEHIEDVGNAGNLLTLVKLLSVNDDLLQKHMESPAMRNATYPSHRRQNEIIEMLAQHLILWDIIDEVKEAEFYAILVDEITIHNREYLAVCV